jgi:hypothetical protein
MAAIVRRERADCPRMAAALRELFGRMRLVVDEARQMAEDPALGKQLTAELRAYDAADRGLADAIFRDLIACKDHPGVQDAMATMPVVPAPEPARGPAPVPAPEPARGPGPGSAPAPGPAPGPAP